MVVKKRIYLALIIIFTGLQTLVTPSITHAKMIKLNPSLNDVIIYDKNTCDEDDEGDPDLSTISPGEGEPNGMTYPKLDAAKMAAAIEKFVKDRAPKGTADADIPLHGTGAVAVRSAKKANMSPFLAYAHAFVESSMGFTTVSGAQVKIHEGHNLFGRSATSSQPRVWEGDRYWYKWTSFKASLDSEAPENKAEGSGGDWYTYDRDVFSEQIDKGMSAYAHRYAPPEDGNDTAAYIKNMQGFLNEMAESAGGTISTSGLETASSSGTSTCCSNPAAGGSTVAVRGDNIETALGHLMSVGSGQKLTLAQAAGIVGNLQQESGESLDPKASNGTHTGIAQWDNENRYPKLVEFAKGVNADPSEFTTQLRYLVWDLTLTNEWSGHTGEYGRALKAIQAASTPEDAAAAYEDTYENSGGQALETRKKNARTLYDKYKDDASLASSKSSSAKGTTAACSGANGDAGKLQELTLKYAWPEGGHGTDRKSDYVTAIGKAESEGRYVGGYHGVDCGGFVTTLIYDSGFDTTYNHNAKNSEGAGRTSIQEAWALKNWQKLGTANGTYEPDGGTFTDDKLQPGDVAFSPGHTWIYVGEISGFGSKYASASYGEKAPAVAGEGFSYNSPTWYRKKGGSGGSGGSSSGGSGLKKVPKGAQV